MFDCCTSIKMKKRISEDRLLGLLVNTIIMENVKFNHRTDTGKPN